MCTHPASIAEPSARGRDADLRVSAVKVVIAGGFGVGKTTLVGSISEITPLSTEELITERSEGVDDLTGVETKTTTTVAMDFGRVTLSSDLVLYLFGTPGQDRFWFLWDELSSGAIGAVVLADTRRLEDCFPSVDYFEERGVPFMVGVNCFDHGLRYTVEEVREALDLGPHTPVQLCDVRKRESSKNLLITLVEYAISMTAIA
jgi:signal recognition particle receptor subunit beta